MHFLQKIHASKILSWLCIRWMKARNNLCHIGQNCRHLCPKLMNVNLPKILCYKKRLKPKLAQNILHAATATSAAITKTKPNRNLSVLSFWFLNCVHLFAYFYSNSNIFSCAKQQQSNRILIYTFSNHTFTQFHSMHLHVGCVLNIQSLV